MNKIEQRTFVLALLTFLGMVGIYVGAVYAYEQYQAYKEQYGTSAGLLSLLGK